MVLGEATETGAMAAGTATGGAGAPAVDAEAKWVLDPLFGANTPTVQLSLCGAKVTSSPFMPLTRRP